MADKAWYVYWNDYAKDTFINGSEIFFHGKDDVEFKNDFMSPGTVIKKWHSKTNFQIDKVEPTLPMIDGEGKYRIRLYCSEDGMNKLLLKIRYYNRYNNEIGSEIIRDGEIIFKCPIQTFSYDVELISSGANHFHFNFIEIMEVEDE